MEHELKSKIAAKLEKIRKYEGEKPVDAAVRAKMLADDYEELGNLYLRAGDRKGASNAFKKAEAADLTFVRSEFSYDKPLMERTLKERKAHWKKFLENLKK